MKFLTDENHFQPSPKELKTKTKTKNKQIYKCSILRDSEIKRGKEK